MVEKKEKEKAKEQRGTGATVEVQGKRCKIGVATDQSVKQTAVPVAREPSRAKPS